MTDTPTRAPSRARRAALPAALLLALVVLWSQVVSRGPVVELDVAVRAWVRERGGDPAVRLAQVVADLATPALSVVLLVSLGAVLAVTRRSWRPVVVALSATGLLGVAVLGLKHLVGRVGPRGDSVLAWPSGHTTTAVVVAGAAVALLPAAWRARGAAVAAAWPALVGVAMVLTTYHWVSDVLAGWLLGPLLLGAVGGVTARLVGRPGRPRRVVAPPDHPVGHARQPRP